MVEDDAMWIVTRQGTYDNPTNHATLPGTLRVPVSPDFVTGRAALEGRSVHSDDIVNASQLCPVLVSPASLTGENSSLEE